MVTRVCSALHANFKAFRYVTYVALSLGRNGYEGMPLRHVRFHTLVHARETNKYQLPLSMLETSWLSKTVSSSSVVRRRSSLRSLRWVGGRPCLPLIYPELPAPPWWPPLGGKSRTRSSLPSKVSLRNPKGHRWSIVRSPIHVDNYNIFIRISYRPSTC